MLTVQTSPKLDFSNWGQHFHLEVVSESRHLQINRIQLLEVWLLEVLGTLQNLAASNCAPEKCTLRTKPNIAGSGFWIRTNNLKQKLATWLLYSSRRGAFIYLPHKWKHSAMSVIDAINRETLNEKYTWGTASFSWHRQDLKETLLWKGIYLFILIQLCNCSLNWSKSYLVLKGCDSTVSRATIFSSSASPAAGDSKYRVSLAVFFSFKPHDQSTVIPTVSAANALKDHFIFPSRSLIKPLSSVMPRTDSCEFALEATFDKYSPSPITFQDVLLVSFQSTW